MRNRRGVAAAGVALLLILAACGDDGVSSGAADGTLDTTTSVTTTTEVVTTDSAADTTEATTVPDTTPPETTLPATTAPETTLPATTAPETTPAPTEPTTTSAPPPPCGEFDPIPVAAAPTSSVPVDWDGDGSQEAVATVYETAAGNMDFRLRVESSDLVTETAVITDGLVLATVLGPVQVDYSGGSTDPQPQELLVVVGANSSGQNVGVFYRDDQGCVAMFKGEDDAELIIPIHASIGTASGLACEGTAGSQFLVRTEAVATATPNEYDVHDVKLARDDDRLIAEVDIPGTVTDDGTPTSPFLRYSSITGCGF